MGGVLCGIWHLLIEFFFQNGRLSALLLAYTSCYIIAATCRWVKGFLYVGIHRIYVDTVEMQSNVGGLFTE